MDRIKTDFLLNTLERTIDNVSTGQDEIREAGLATIGIARDLANSIPIKTSDNIESLKQDIRYLEEKCDKLFDPYIVLSTMAIFLGGKEKYKIKAIKNLRERTGMNLSDAKVTVEQWEEIWENNIFKNIFPDKIKKL